MLEVSVVIPVYNAEQFLEKAVESALVHPEVKEILLIEDGSPDNSLEVCKKLEQKHSTVRLLRHDGGINKGASASRNLGIRSASHNMVAFLDADDYYLPNRFEKEAEIFEHDPEVDGVYGALGFHSYSETNKQKYVDLFKSELTSVREKFAPEKLKLALLNMCRDDKGYFHLDTLTVKKDLALKVGLISEEFDFHEDTHFIIKMSFFGKLVPGIIDKPIGMRGVHESNRIISSRNNAYSKFLMLKELEKWVTANVEGEEHAKRFITKDRKVYQLLSSEKNTLTKTYQVLKLFIEEPFAYHIEFSFNKLMYGLYGGRIGRVLVRSKKRLYETLLNRQFKKWDAIIYGNNCD
jgi:glycosyltransferase involved in cell wall biosynthesis